MKCRVLMTVCLLVGCGTSAQSSDLGEASGGSSSTGGQATETGGATNDGGQPQASGSSSTGGSPSSGGAAGGDTSTGGIIDDTGGTGGSETGGTGGTSPCDGKVCANKCDPETGECVECLEHSDCHEPGKTRCYKLLHTCTLCEDGDVRSCAGWGCTGTQTCTVGGDSFGSCKSSTDQGETCDVGENGCQDGVPPGVRCPDGLCYAPNTVCN